MRGRGVGRTRAVRTGCWNGSDGASAGHRRDVYRTSVDPWRDAGGVLARRQQDIGGASAGRRRGVGRASTGPRRSASRTSAGHWRGVGDAQTECGATHPRRPRAARRPAQVSDSGTVSRRAPPVGSESPGCWRIAGQLKYGGESVQASDSGVALTTKCVFFRDRRAATKTSFLAAMRASPPRRGA